MKKQYLLGFLLLLTSTIGMFPSGAFANENIDTDGDGVTDDLDGCPDEKESWNKYNDHDGCPDIAPEQSRYKHDADLDDIINEYDMCPLEAEDYDGDRDLDGCPDLQDVFLE